jgi:putative ABC transport system permease protein
VPPRWAEQLLRWRCPEDQLEEVQGDWQELFETWATEAGPAKARRRYAFHVLGFLRPLPWRKSGSPSKPKMYFHLRTNPSTNPFPMLRNYLIIALRNLIRHPLSSFINVISRWYGRGAAHWTMGVG